MNSSSAVAPPYDSNHVVSPSEVSAHSHCASTAMEPPLAQVSEVSSTTVEVVEEVQVSFIDMEVKKLIINHNSLAPDRATTDSAVQQFKPSSNPPINQLLIPS